MNPRMMPVAVTNGCLNAWILSSIWLRPSHYPKNAATSSAVRKPLAIA